MESIALLIYRIVEKELINDREATVKEFAGSVQEAVHARRPKAFKLIRSTTVDAGKRHSDQTVYRMHLALEDVFSLLDPAYLKRKEQLEKALRTVPLVQDGSIDVELEGEELYSPSDYMEHFGNLESM